MEPEQELCQLRTKEVELAVGAVTIHHTKIAPGMKCSSIRCLDQPHKWTLLQYLFTQAESYHIEYICKSFAAVCAVIRVHEPGPKALTCTNKCCEILQ